MNKYDTCCPNDTAYPVGDDMVIGLTKRELFAAMAMQGYISAGSTGMPCPEDIAKYALDTADELINALNEQK